ncbi:glycosyltransferase [Paenibacillus sp. YAF4_2]|uniref:glycosyltransferase n=1 Tax=Paenibacillus sp. YAF4_2 TaxID=3233085 RepID=UPI003F9B4BFE
MKIGYLIHWNEGPESGVFKKVVNQMQEWIRLGNEVSLFLFTHRPDIKWEAAAIDGIEIVIEHYSGWRDRFAGFKRLAEAVNAWHPDVIYHRFDLYYGSLPQLLRRFPSILEINTNDLTEMRMERNVRYYYHVLTRSRVLRAASGYVFVSGELAKERHFAKYVRDRTIIGNGIRLDEIAPVPVVSNESPRFVFIGSAGQTWHGVDAIAAIAAIRPQWQFDIIGVEAAELGANVPSNMSFHGKLTSSQYQPLMDRADIAIGTLALYRKQMHEASPLKVREYLANGLPVITAYKETDFTEAVPFILRLPNEANNTMAGIDAIDRFVAEWRGKRVDRELIRHLDTALKEAQRVAYMKHITEIG